MRPPEAPGLRRNARLFALLLLVNGFVGVMVGMERTLVPLLGAQEFRIASTAAVLSFIVTFGVTKAFANLAAGAWAAQGRRRVLLAGWLAGLPVPVLLMLAPAPHWWLVLAANVLLGVNQGLCWSMTVIMKVDIAGETRRGFAMGLNEFLGYTAVAGAAFATGWLASDFGLRPVPFLLGLAAAVAGLALSLLVPETVHLAGAPPKQGLRERLASLRSLTVRPAMLPLNQAGLVNNLNDGVSWGLLPLLFAAALRDTATIGALVALYPLAWGLGQLATGPLSDRVGRKALIVPGLALQALALVATAATRGVEPWAAAMVLYGLGTAMCYPALLSAVADVAPGPERAAALGVYRFWRDLGFAAGAVLGGVAADLAGVPVALQVTAALTLGSAVWAAAALRERRPRRGLAA